VWLTQRSAPGSVEDRRRQKSRPYSASGASHASPRTAASAAPEAAPDGHGHRRGPACRTGARAPRRATAAGFRAPRAQPPCRGRESTAPRPRPRERTVSHTVFEPMLRLRPCWEDSRWIYSCGRVALPRVVASPLF
jgi:hypothetical protein